MVTNTGEDGCGQPGRQYSGFYDLKNDFFSNVHH